MGCEYIPISQGELVQVVFIFYVYGEDIFPNQKMASYVRFPKGRLPTGDFYIFQRENGAMFLCAARMTAGPGGPVKPWRTGLALFILKKKTTARFHSRWLTK